MRYFETFDVDTQIFFSELPIMKPLEKTNSNGLAVWQLHESMTISWYDSSRKKYTLRIPNEFVTDFASTPKWIHWWLPPWNPKYTPACLPHDLGYERNGKLTLWVEDSRTGLRTPLQTNWSRLAIDQLMLAGMRSRDVGEFTCQTIYRSVRVGGRGAWERANVEFNKDSFGRRHRLGYTDGIRD